jgi:hypothetical protein
MSQPLSNNNFPNYNLRQFHNLNIQHPTSQIEEVETTEQTQSSTGTQQSNSQSSPSTTEIPVNLETILTTNQTQQAVSNALPNAVAPTNIENDIQWNFLPNVPHDHVVIKDRPIRSAETAYPVDINIFRNQYNGTINWSAALRSQNDFIPYPAVSARNNVDYGSLAIEIFGNKVVSDIDHYTGILREAAAGYIQANESYLTRMLKDFEVSTSSESEEEIINRLKPILQNRLKTYCDNVRINTGAPERIAGMEMGAISAVFRTPIHIFNINIPIDNPNINIPIDNPNINNMQVGTDGIERGVIQPNCVLGGTFSGAPIRLVYDGYRHVPIHLHLQLEEVETTEQTAQSSTSTQQSNTQRSPLTTSAPINLETILTANQTQQAVFNALPNAPTVIDNDIQWKLLPNVPHQDVVIKNRPIRIAKTAYPVVNIKAFIYQFSYLSDANRYLYDGKINWENALRSQNDIIIPRPGLVSARNNVDYASLAIEIFGEKVKNDINHYTGILREAAAGYIQANEESYLSSLIEFSDLSDPSELSESEEAVLDRLKPTLQNRLKTDCDKIRMNIAPPGRILERISLREMDAISTVLRTPIHIFDINHPMRVGTEGIEEGVIQPNCVLGGTFSDAPIRLIYDGIHYNVMRLRLQ